MSSVAEWAEQAERAEQAVGSIGPRSATVVRLLSVPKPPSSGEHVR